MINRPRHSPAADGPVLSPLVKAGGIGQNTYPWETS